MDLRPHSAAAGSRGRVYALLLLLAASPALADRAWIVRIEHPDVFIDAGAREGLVADAELRALKSVDAVHPATGKRLKQAFAVGSLRVVDVGEGMSRLTGAADLLDRLEVGDLVELPAQVIVRSAPAPRSRTIELPPQIAQGAPVDPSICPAAPSPLDLTPLRETWLKALDLPRAARAELWERFIAKHPEIELEAPLRREIALLRSEHAPAPPAKTRVTTKLQLSGPSEIAHGDPLVITATALDGPVPHTVLVHWRAADAPTYRTTKLDAVGLRQHQGALVGEGVAAPAILYFVEAIGAGGAVVGSASADAPHVVRVGAPLEDPPADLRDRTRARLHYEFVDFNKLVGNDQYHVVEGDILYRLHTALHSMRVGFGVYQGRGAPRALLDSGTGVRDVGFHYGYTEFELRLFDSLGAIGRVSAGVSREGLQGGFESKLRLGEENGTSLVVGAAMTGGIGQRGSLALAWNAVEGWPMMAEVIVTNEPIGEDLGVRLLYSVGRRVTDWLDLVGRVGYQLRDIDHSGISAGLGTAFHW